MKIIILGGSGLIGNQIINAGKNNHEIIGIYQTNKIELEGINSHKINLTENFDILTNLIKTEKPEIVINSAGISNVDFCEKFQKECYKINTELPRNLTKISLDYNFKLIQLSTDYVFNGKKEKYFEKDLVDPINFYGKTKAEAEQIVLKNSKNIVIRTSTIYGWNPQIRFFNYVLDQLKHDKLVKISHNGKNCPTLLDDLVRLIYGIIDLGGDGIFHGTGSSCISKKFFAEKIAQKFHLNDELIVLDNIDDTIAKRPQNTCLSNKKTENETKIKLSTIDEGLEKIYKKNK